MDGAPYFVAVRLILIAAERWVEIDGEAAINGSPSLMRLTLDRFCNAIQTWCLQRITTEEETSQFLFRLTEPLPGMRVTEAVIADEADGFAAFAGAFGVTAPGNR